MQTQITRALWNPLEHRFSPVEEETEPQELSQPLPLQWFWSDVSSLPGYLSKPLVCLALVVVNVDIIFLCHVTVQGEEGGVTRVGVNYPMSSVFHIHGAVVNDIICRLRTAVDGIRSTFNEKQNPKKPYSPETWSRAPRKLAHFSYLILVLHQEKKLRKNYWKKLSKLSATISHRLLLFVPSNPTKLNNLVHSKLGFN